MLDTADCTHHVCGVEDVQPLVLHGAHVEVVGGHDVVDVEVALQACRGEEGLGVRWVR